MRTEPLGDRGVQVVLGTTPDDETRLSIAAAAERLHRAGIPGLMDCVPGFTTLTVLFDPLHALTATAAVREALGPPLRIEEAGQPATVDVLVHYGGEHGPDLEALAGALGMTTDEVVRRHAAGEYRVHMIGFVPGFPYLTGLDPTLAAPRLANPRKRVPAGSVAIGGSHAGVYPIDSPGGWHLLGWTSLPLFDPKLDPPVLLRPGDRVRFRPASIARAT